jgi:hypothetical protein
MRITGNARLHSVNVSANGLLIGYGIDISRFWWTENRQNRFGNLAFFKRLFLWDKFHKSSLLVIPIKILGGFPTYPTIFRERHESIDVPIITPFKMNWFQGHLALKAKYSKEFFAIKRF